MIKVSIIEDEPQIRKILCKVIENQDGFQLVSESGSFSEAITDFNKFYPDVVFVDIDLKGESGLECAKVMTQLNPKLKVIFATAHSEYMANAFEIYAFDYLVKPFDVERINRTLKRIKEHTLESDNAENVIQSEKHGDKLMIKGKEQIAFIDKEDIIFIERKESSTIIVTKDEVYKTSVSLGSLEEKLDSKDFMRSHKSYIINLHRITKIEPYGRWTYVVKFKGTSESALMTSKCYEEIKKMFG
ncbi:MAG: response regulator transcription factor [Lachnospiraceae bacterium]|nr:response regulator transcription factor [Lachnospiraceae bacterium]